MKLSLLVALGLAGGCVRSAPVPAAAATVEAYTPSGVWYARTGAGPVVVLVHGATLDSRIWDDQVAALGRFFTVVRLRSEWIAWCSSHRL